MRKGKLSKGLVLGIIVLFVGVIQITFFSDGTGTVSGKGMSWELKDNMLSIASSDGEYSFATEYKFLEDNTKLQLLGSDLEDIYTKI